MNSSILKKTIKTQNDLNEKTLNEIKLQQVKVNSLNFVHKSITNEQLVQMIQRWDVYFRVDEKFQIWAFQFQKQRMKRLPQQLYNRLIHYFCLKKLSAIIKDYHQNFVIQTSYKIKEIYKQLSLSGKFKGNKFNCFLLTAVKLISYFIGSHTTQVDTDLKLQTQIFLILNYVILGATVSSKTYNVILQHNIKKAKFLNSRGSIFMRSLVKNKSNVFKQHEKTSHSKKRIGKYQFRSGSALFESVYNTNQLQNQLSMFKFKEQVKANLFVKQFIPKPKLKENLNEVIMKTLISNQLRQKDILQVKNMQNQMKHKKIFFTQLSNSMNLSDDIQLNEIKNHYVQIKPQKKSKYFRIIDSQQLPKNEENIQKYKKINLSSSSKTLQSKSSTISTNLDDNQQRYLFYYNENVSGQNKTLIKNKRQSQYWKRIISQMKENKFKYMQKFPPINMKQYLKKIDFNDKYKISSENDYLLNIRKNSIKNQQIQQASSQQRLFKIIQNKLQQSQVHQKPLQLVQKNQHISEHIKNFKKLKEQQQVYKQWKKNINTNTYANYQQQQMKNKKQKKKMKIKQIKQKLENFQKQCVEREQRIQNFYIEKTS